jgi:hypothetical protein
LEIAVPTYNTFRRSFGNLSIDIIGEATVETGVATNIDRCWETSTSQRSEKLPGWEKSELTSTPRVKVKSSAKARLP